MVRADNGHIYQFDLEGRLSSINNGKMGEWRFSYAAEKQTVQVVPLKSNLDIPVSVISDWQLLNVTEYQNNVLTGRDYTFSYDPNTGLLASVETQGGQRLELFYDEDATSPAEAHGLLSRIVSSGNATDTITYWLNPNDRWRRTYGLLRTFGNNDCGTCTIRENFYDSEGRVSRQVQGANQEGEDITFNYNNINNPTAPFVETTHRINLLTPNGSGGFNGTNIDTRRERTYFSLHQFLSLIHI